MCSSSVERVGEEPASETSPPCVHHLELVCRSTAWLCVSPWESARVVMLLPMLCNPAEI